MKINKLSQLLTALSLVFTALPLRAVLAAPPSSAAPADLLQFAAGGHVLGFTEGRMYAATGTHALQVDFVDSNRVRPRSDSPAGEPGQAAALARVAYADLWDGIDLEYTSTADGIYTTTYTLSPGADPADIRLRYNAPLNINEDGTLSVAFETGVMVESAPAAWQEIDGERVTIDIAFQVNGQDAAFMPGSYDPGYALTIDPTLIWNSFLGGSGDDTAYSIAVDGSGNAYLMGTAGTSWGTPVRAYSGGNSDVFVVMLNSSGEPVWNTFLGGTSAEMGEGIALGPGGYIYVSGTGGNWGSPIRSYSGGWDAFAAKLDTDGSLIWNTCLGGTNQDYGHGVTVDESGSVYVVGNSSSTWGSPVRAFTDVMDVFAVKLDTNGNLVWNTFLGGSGNDTGLGIAKDFAGSLYLTGYSSADWGSPVRAYTAGNDAFAAELDTASGSLTWNTFLGGTGDDRGAAIVAATNGAAIVILGEYSTAAWGTPVRAYTSGWDAFAAKVDTDGSLVWNTFLGSDGEDTGRGIAMDGSGNSYITGDSSNSWGSPLRAFTAADDAYAAKLNTAGTLVWNTFLGGSGDDKGAGIAFLWTGYVYVCGYGDISWGSPVQNVTGGQDTSAVMLTDSGALLWNTFTGGVGNDEAYSIAVDGGGSVYVAGYSTAPWGSPLRAFTGDRDAFAAKLNSSGALVWNTFLGGSGEDGAHGIGLDGSGNVYLAGYSTQSWGGPLHAHSGGWDIFAAKLNSSGALMWNTFLGGSGDESGDDLFVGGGGDLYVTGPSDEAWGTPVRAFAGDVDAFAAKLDTNGSLTWNTFLGGSAVDYAAGIAVDGAGNVYLAGKSRSGWGSPVRAYTASDDGFAAKLNSAGGLDWNTFLGGGGDDYCHSLALDENGNVYVAGFSYSSWGSPVRAYTGGIDAYAIRLNSTGGLTWLTFLGGNGDDIGTGIVVDGSGDVVVGGYSDAAWGDPVRAYTGGKDAYTAKLNSSGTLSASTFLGGDGNDLTFRLALDGNADVYVAGSSNQTWGAPGDGYAAGFDAFAAKLDFSPPEPFAKTGPADGSFATTHPTLAWETTGGADAYEYCYDSTDNNDCDASWISAGTSTSVGLSGLGNNGTYFWQVRAVNGDGTTPADGGTWWSFTARNQTFADVPIDHVFWEEIEAFYNAGITTGCGVSPLIYCPEQNVTRAAMAVFLLRTKYGASYAPPPATHIFADLPVPGKEWQEAWVDQFYLEGITTGCGTGPLIYCPENPVTRAAMAVFILRTIEGPSYTPPAASHYFADMPVAGKEWMEPWVDEFYRRGITTGCGISPFVYCPEDAVKRQAMAAFIVRAFGLPMPM
jgi:hypothetical protein